MSFLSWIRSRFSRNTPLAATTVKKNIIVDNFKRVYFVFASSSVARSSKPVPLVLVLHGGEGDGQQIEEHTKFSSLARREDLIVCYPNGYGKNWNDGRDVDSIETQSKNIDDVKFLREVVKAISKEYPVDQSRVFAAGISNGAFMSHRLANDASDMICGVATVAGGIAEPIADTFHPEHPVSLFVIHGDADPLVPINGGLVGRGIHYRGKVIPTEETIAKYVERNHVQDWGNFQKWTAMTVLLPNKYPDDGTRTIARSYNEGQNGFKIQYYLVRRGGHVWPGATTGRPIGNAVTDFYATTDIWNFFKTCPSRSIVF